MNPEHPPLSLMLGALPLLALDAKFPHEPTLWAQSDAFTMGWKFLFFENDAEKLFFWARFPLIGLGMLLGYFIYRWARELYGERAGVFALLLYIFCPNILAHVGLIHTDIPVTAFIFLSCYFFTKLLCRVTLGHFLQTTMCFSLALLSKYSAVLLLPGFLLIGIAWILINPPVNRKREDGGMGERGNGRKWRKGLILLFLLTCMGLSGYLALWAGYGFRYKAMKEPVGRFILPWEVVTPKTGFTKEVSRFIREHKLLPEAYIYGFLYTHLTTQKRQSFLAGAYSLEGWWYYFVIAFLIKTPLPFLILLALTVLSYLRKGDPAWSPLKRPAQQEELMVILPPALYFAFSLTAHINIGLRHILPVYPFLFVLVSRLVPLVKIEDRRQKPVLSLVEGAESSKLPTACYLLPTAMWVLTIWLILCSLWIHPDYLAYFNELVGGPDNGYKYLVDSNLDWGQDLKGLKKYMDDHGIEKINLAYFGTADPGYYGINHNRLPGFLDYKGRWLEGTIDFRYPIAISVSLLQGVPFINHDLYKNFLAIPPVAKIGYSIFIYQITNPKQALFLDLWFVVSCNRQRTTNPLLSDTLL